MITLKVGILVLFCAFVPAIFAQGCGVVKIKGSATVVNGGNTSYPGQWPWHVAIFSKSDNRILCGATLIDNQHIVTGKYIRMPH